MNNRQLAALQTRKKIILAARELFEEKSFEDVSIEEITDRAGVATGSFYTYFKRKEAIIEELTHNDFFHLDEVVNKMEDKSIEYKISYYAKKHFGEIETVGIEICRQWLKNNLTDGSDNELGKSKYDYDYEILKSILDNAVKNKQLSKDTPVKDIAVLINAQLYGLLIGWCMSDGKNKGSKYVDRYIKLVISRILKPYII